jgi:uncharacterized protein YukE
VYEEFFGDPPSLLRLAAALQQTSEGLWQLQQTLNQQVTGLVPTSWDGPAATAFRTHWDTRANDVRQAAELARRLQNTIGRLGAELGAAKAQFMVGEEIVMANGLTLFYTGVGFAVTCDSPSPQQVAAMAAAQADVMVAWTEAEKAWGQAHVELAVDTLPILGGLKDILLAPVRAVGDFADMAIGAADFVNRLGSGDLAGAWKDVESAAAAVGHTLKVVGQAAWQVIETSGELNPDAYATTEEFLKRQDEIGKAMNEKVQQVLDRPGNFITGTGTLAIEVLGPGAVAKALRMGAVADAAAFEREAAAADAAAATTRTGWIGRAGEANEAAGLTSMAQRGEAATNLNRMTYTGRGGEFPGYDAMSDRTLYSAKAHGLNDPADRIGRTALGQYERDFQRLTDPESAVNRNAAATLLDSRNAADVASLQERGVWPAGLARDANAGQVADFAGRNGVLSIPDNHVAPVQDMLRQQIPLVPSRYGLPEGVTPTDAQIQGLVDRVQPSGITTDGLNRVAPPLDPTRIPTPVFPAPSPGGGLTVPPALPVVPSGNPVLPAPSPAGSPDQ